MYGYVPTGARVPGSLGVPAWWGTKGPAGSAWRAADGVAGPVGNRSCHWATRIWAGGTECPAAPVAARFGALAGDGGPLKGTGSLGVQGILLSRWPHVLER